MRGYKIVTSILSTVKELESAMKLVHSAALGAAFGAYIYFLAMGNLWLALVPVLLLVVIAVGRKIFAPAKDKPAPLSLLVFLFLSTAVAYLLPEEPSYALTIAVVSCVVVFAFAVWDKPVSAHHDSA